MSPYSQMHPIILHGKHPLTKLIVGSEHLRLLHTGPTLVFSCTTFPHSGHEEDHPIDRSSVLGLPSSQL